MSKEWEIDKPFGGGRGTTRWQAMRQAELTMVFLVLWFCSEKKEGSGKGKPAGAAASNPGSTGLSTTSSVHFRHQRQTQRERERHTHTHTRTHTHTHTHTHTQAFVSLSLLAHKRSTVAEGGTRLSIIDSHYRHFSSTESSKRENAGTFFFFVACSFLFCFRPPASSQLLLSEWSEWSERSE